MALLLFSFTTQLRAQAVNCFEIESILVDACGSPEGENEMVRFLVGSSDLNTINLQVIWPNIAFQGICQNATTAGKVATLNSTITGCGYILEPTAGNLPAGSTVILVTSTNMDPTFNSFNNLNDTIYMIFQCPGNVTAHFKNYQSGAGSRTLELDFAGSCNDIVTYIVDSLIDQSGLHSAEDGATVNFDFAGNDSYTNSGCQAPIVPLAYNVSVSSAVVCAGATVTVTAAITSGTYQSYFWSGGAGVFANANLLSTSYQTNSIFTGTDNLYFGIVGNCGDTIYDTLTIQINAGLPVTITANGPTSFCSGDSVILTAVGGGPYAWSQGATTSTITVLTAGTYTVTQNSACGTTSASQTVSVTSPQQVAITPSGATTFCQGDSVILVSSGTGTYLWSTGSINDSITVLNSGSYSVTLTDGCGQSTANIAVNVTAGPTASITASGPLTFCQGGSVDLTASGGNTFLWSNGATTANINVTTAGNYTVTVTSTCGTSTSAQSVVVNIPPVASITPSGSLQFCQGGSVTLTANGNGTYLWSNGATSPAVNITSAGNYTVTVTNNCGSSTSATSVIVDPLPLAVIAASGPLTFCQGGSVDLTASGGTSYSWSDGSASATITATLPGIYTVTATNNCGTSTTSNTVVVELPPVANVTQSNTVICPDDSVLLIASGGNSYLWSNGDTGSSIYVNTSGNYTVTVTNNCGTDQTNAVLTSSNLVAAYTLDPSSGIAPLTVTFTSNSQNAISWLWDFANGSTSADTNPVSTFNTAGFYIIVLTVEDINGCKASFQDTIDVIPGEVFVPNVFSPNDDGVNDNFNVVSNSIEDLNARVFNRWGQEIAAWSSPINGWTGKNSNGDEAPAGVYFYLIKVKVGGQQQRTIRGTVTLIR